jgi:hypothetical protein
MSKGWEGGAPRAWPIEASPQRNGDPLLPKPDWTLASPARMGYGAGRGCCGVVRGCPLGTDKDRCEWHSSGTAGEDDFAHLAPSALPYRRSEPVLASQGRWQAAKAVRRSD